MLGGSTPRTGWLVGLASLAAAAFLWWPALRDPAATGILDWQFFLHMWEAGRVAVARHGEWPLWDPYHCGGITLFRNPQSQVYGPLFALAFVFGSPLALKLFAVLHAAAGFAGAWLFARREGGLSPAASALASAAWAASGFFAWHGVSGHVAMLPFWLTPWALLAWRAAAREPRRAVWVAACLALVLFEGGMYPFAYLSLLLGFDALCRLHPSTWRPIALAGAVAAGLSALLGAPRLLPILAQMAAAPRHTADPDRLTPLELLEMLTARSHDWLFEGHRYMWHEYALYLGWGVVALAALGALLALRRRSPVWLLGALLFGGLALGDHGPLSPWGLLHGLPPFSSLRVPSRFGVLLAFYLALLAGLGLDALREAAQRRLGPGARAPRLAALGIAALCAGDVLLAGSRTLDDWRRPLAEERPAERHHLKAVGHWSYLQEYASYPRLGVGSVECYEAMHHRVADGLWVGDVAQARIASGRGRVLDWGRSTSRAWARVTLATPGSVLFNQNFAPGWSSTPGRVGSDAGGRLVVEDLPPGEHRIELRYRPPELGSALALGGVGLALALLWWRAGNRFGSPLSARS